jgi:hypothetical protein
MVCVVEGRCRWQEGMRNRGAASFGLVVFKEFEV